MTSLSYNYPDHARLHRRGWLCSMAFHAATGIVALTALSRLAPSFEPDQFQWNVALVEAPKPQVVESPPTPTKPVVEPVQQQVIEPARVVRRQVAQAVETPTHVATINQTASTLIPQAVEQHEVSQMPAPITTQERVVEEEAAPATEVASNEAATPAVEPLISHTTTDAVVQQPPVEAASETPAQVRQPDAEQVAALAAPVKAAPATKADYAWLMKALLGRINELKNYPVMARINRWEGKVVLRAVIKDDGQVLMVDVQESSGRSILDNDAMETLRKASPLKLDHPLGKSQVAILMPISYSLR